MAKVVNSSCEEDVDSEIASGFDEFIASSDSDSTDLDEDSMLDESDEFNDWSSESDSEFDEDRPQPDDTPLVVATPTVCEPSLTITRNAQFEAPQRPRGYRLCGDNIDKTVRPRYMHSDKRNQSLHYFHSYAVQNRVNVSNLSDSPVNITLSPERMATSILPSIEDDSKLKCNMAVLVSRVLASHMKFFNFSFADAVKWHIEHQFSEEMSQKSVVVSMQIFSGSSHPRHSPFKKNNNKKQQKKNSNKTHIAFIAFIFPVPMSLLTLSLPSFYINCLYHMNC